MIRKCVPIPQKTNNVTKRLQTPQKKLKTFPGLLAFIDCTEQQIPRSVDKNKRKMSYSGKRTIYTVKNKLMVNKDSDIIHKAAHKKGRRHDFIFNILE
jgi:hypothetical protein